jgi:hypothetical protein
MKLKEVLQANKVMVILLEILDEKALDFVSPY